MPGLAESPLRPWVLGRGWVNESAVRKYRRRHEAEVTSCLLNLDKLMAALAPGVPWLKAAREFPGFLKHEEGGIYRIKQTAVVASRETRLYLYVDEQSRMVFPLTIAEKGQKKQQQKDLAKMRRIAEDIRRALR